MNEKDFPGLALDSPLALPSAANFCPPSWPPPANWPVIIDELGKTVSIWSDSIWTLDVWSTKRCVLNFGDGAVRKCEYVDTYNANLLRLVVGWWLYGPCRVRTVQTLHIRLSVIRPIFSLCAKEKIQADKLQYEHDVIDKIPDIIWKSNSEMVVFLLDELLAFSDVIGFKLLTRSQILKMAARTPEHTKRQTPYVPPRIWLYQVTCLRHCLEDFWENRKNIEEFFKYCLSAYIKNYGSLKEATSIGKNTHKAPFSGKYRNFGSFSALSSLYGMDGLLIKWISSSKKKDRLSVDMLASYFSLVNYAAIAFILNFSLMRSEDAMQLRRGCLKIVEDAKFGNMYLIEGVNSKFDDQEIVHWVTSASSCLAIQVLELIGELRRLCKENIQHDRLFQSITEPWGCGNKPEDERNIPVALSYQSLLQRYPQLMNKENLRIQAKDLELARLITPTLNDGFFVGGFWKLAYHQLRRTGSVNMQASGFVSDTSLQFELKHVTRAMSLYYGRNHTKLRLEQTAQHTYVKAGYEVIGRRLEELASERFISPHGVRRKDELVRLITPSDLKETLKLAKKGGVPCREVILGVCMNKEPCPYGGIESVAHCGGGDGERPCSEVLYDEKKVAQVLSLQETLLDRCNYLPTNSPLFLSLQAQIRSIHSYLSTVGNGGEYGRREAIPAST